MLVLDTDHASLLGRPDGRAAVRLVANLDARSQGNRVVTTIVTFEEQARGWLAYGARGVEAEVEAYGRLFELVEFYRRMPIIPFDGESAIRYQQLRSLKLGVGAMDLKIAAVALVNSATLLSRNLRNFRKVPGLAVEDWSA